MAKSRSSVEQRQMYQQAQKKKQFDATCRKLNPLGWIAVAAIGLTLIFFFLNWMEIYNTDIPGTEVTVNGWAAFAAGLTNNFSQMGGVYGDIAVPFYYYAPDWTLKVARFTLVVLPLLLISLAGQIFAGVKKNLTLNVATAALNLIAGVLLLLCFTTAVSMSGSDILPIYCQSNPACSIRSFAILPALLMLGAAAVNVVVALKFFQARKQAQ